ncbi:MAG: hypothetical protein PHT96_10090 [Syntrophorhabdaceae bacterium]|nr:hypothetical protein [Syntrophorhabdaceae bacterium]
MQGPDTDMPWTSIPERFFDTASHDMLMARVARRVKGKRPLKARPGVHNIRHHVRRGR